MRSLSDAMKAYRRLEEDLRQVRTQNDLGSVREDPILEEMARLRWLLAEDERETLDREGPTCDPEKQLSSAVGL